MTGFGYTGNDSSLGVQTPEGIEFVLYPAGLLARGCAWFIDTLAQLALLIVVSLLSRALVAFLGVWFLLLALFALNWFYHTAFEVFCRGQSPGKRLMGLRVVRSDGSPVNPGASFLRNLLRFADAFLFLYLIVFVCILVSPAFRRFGDWIGDTLVVYSRARASGGLAFPAIRQSGMAWLADVPPAESSVKLAYEEKQAILSFASRYPLLGKARADEIAGILVGKLKGAAVAPETAPVGSGPDSSPSAYLLGIARGLAV